MKVLLLDNVAKLGKMGQVKDVSDGYARNYLFPRRLAVVATSFQIKKQSEIISKRQAGLAAEKEKYGLIMADIAKYVVTLKRKATDEGKLFGKVNEADIKKELINAGFDVANLEIDLSSVTKMVGEYDVEVSYDDEIKTKVKLVIEKEE